MCGITGYWGAVGADTKVVREMADRLTHRGPDSAGVWSDQHTGLWLGHRRLSIVDLSPGGHQPMVSPCGRYVIVYNGEIYNHADLRAELERQGGGFDWRGHSDSETLLAALRHWGVERALSRFNGMFAFALWDTVERSLFLARDRMGEKPLYYGRSGDSLLFGSELKALTAHPGWQGQVDRDALALLLRFNNVPTPKSIYRGIYKLPPAHYVVVRNNGLAVSEPVCYWNLAQVAADGIRETAGNLNALADELDVLLRDSVGCRMLADVPLGAFLSGGFDSTMVVAQMQAQSARPVKTFSIGSTNTNYDEAHHAAAVARHLGTDHTELYVTPSDAQAVIPRLPTMFDEPFADSSQIPTFLVSKLARQDVTVVLSGDGGDELFGGYNRHVVGPGVWNRVQRLPLPLRRCLSEGIAAVTRRDLHRWKRCLPERLQVPSLELKLGKLSDALGASDERAFYRSLCSHWKVPEQVVLGASESQEWATPFGHLSGLPGLREQMMLLDMLTYLPDDILAKVDRASMAASLEARAPLLDHRLVEFAWRVPTEYKVRDGQGKWLLRQVLDRYVPRSMMERPKQGFGVPIDHWLRSSLREWAEDLLDEYRLRHEGFFDPAPIRKLWSEYLLGRGRSHHHLWCVLMFQAWWAEQDGQGRSN